MKRIDLFKQHLNEKRAVKAIAGINNFDIDNVKKVILTASEAGASAVDICAKKEIIEMAMENSNIAVFVSSIKPEELVMAVEMGVDAIELGNFDALYADGLSMSADEVLNLTRKTLELLNGREIFFSVTIPGNLDINSQIELARELQLLGVNLIQTEGHNFDKQVLTGVRGLLDNAQLTIANTIEISRNIDLPVMTASSINPSTAALAFAAGASAIGCGSCINKLESEISMLAVTKNLVEIANKNTHKVLELV